MFFPSSAPPEPTAEQVCQLRFSLNTPRIALDGDPAGKARAAILVRSLQPDGALVSIALRLGETGSVRVFEPDVGAVSGAELVPLVEAAISFCEAMGFVFDEDVAEGGARREAALARWQSFLAAGPVLEDGPAPVPGPLRLPPARRDPGEVSEARPAAQRPRNAPGARVPLARLELVRQPAGPPRLGALARILGSF